ncbi:tandem-95 repeat protein [Vibrio campbellii]|uniref:tandem-95 repeat protein n=1 Tax=Vibrio campbellii TaxID=680 RepID=UPI000CD35C2B|nr:Ig-like domain-containing protein [Vibrio campbellii]AUV86140.1 hypothetical protein C1N50_08280 [Vibrio campbellii]
MDRTSLVSFGGQLVVVGLDGKLRTLIENEQPLQGEVIVARNDAEPIGLNVQLVKENGVQDVSDDVAQILGALEAGQDPTQLGDEFASAAGQSDGSSLQTSGTVDRIGAELLADTGFETIGLESLGFSQTQILSLNELYLNTLRGNETSPAVEPAAPVAGDDIVQTDEDSAIIIDVLANDEDADSENLFIESATVPEEQGTVEIEDGKLIFTPAEDFNGDADITYVVSDGELEDEASVTVTVNPLNDAPVANDDNVVTDEETPVTIDILPNDIDVDGDTLTIVNASVPADQGTVEIVDGKLVFTPVKNFNGEATISYTVSDGALEDSAEVSVTVNPINDAPVANDDSAVTDEDTPVTIDVLPNDTDIEGDTLTIVNASVPADQGTVEIVDGKLVFTPADNFNGEASISYTVSDGALEDSAEVSVTVNPVNDAPVANDDSAVTDEDTPVTIDVLPNDTDVDGDTLTIVNASVPVDQGTVEIVDGKLVFTPAENFNGEATISYTVSDGELEDSAEVSVTVNPVNDAPVANDDSAVTDEDTPVTIDVLSNDTDVDGDTLTIVNASVPVDQGTVEIVDGKLVFTPADNFNGEATISYTVSDGELEDSAEVSVTVNPVNDAPVANDDNTVTDEDTPVTINVLPNDTDVDGDTLSIVNASVPADQGTVEVVDGKLVFTPAENFNGKATISYTVSDGELEDSAEVSVTVNPLNDAPVANDDSAATDEDTPVTIDVLPNDTDIDGDTLTIVNASVPADQGTVEIVDGKLVFTPADNFNGEATISYTVSDGALEDSAEVTVTVNPINDASVANDDNAVTDEDTPVTINVLPNDTDVDGDTLSIVNASVPADQGTVEIVDGKLVFTPADNFNGEATISYTVSDGELEDSAQVSVTVNPVNDAPVANDDSAVTDEDTPVTIDVLPNDTDVDGDTLSIVNASVPADQGTVEIVDGKLVFTPADNFNGEATISYTVSDGELEDSAEVSVTVNPVNDAPVANDDNVVTDEDTPVTIDVLPNDTDVDGDTLTIVNASVPADQGAVEIVDGKLVFTPAENFNGEATISYTVSDGVLEDSAEVSVTVNPINDAPVANDDSAVTDEDTPVTIDVLPNDTDVDGDTLTIVNASVPVDQGTVEIVDGKLVFTPADNFNGEATISYTVSDGELEDSAEVSVTVNPVNDAPVANDDSAVTDEDTPVTIDVLPNDTDVDGDTLSIVNASVPADQGTVEIVDGKLVFTPADNFNGEATISYTVSDGELEDSAEVSVTVNPVNDAPVANDDNAVTDEDTPVTIDVLPNDTDVDGHTLTIVNASVPADQGTVEIVDGKLVFTPADNFNGEATISYTVSDGELEDSAEVSVTVNPVNDAPVANDDSAVTDEDTPVTIDVLPNDTDVDGDTLSIVNASVPADQGTVEIVDGKLVFTPADNFNGEATISYTVSDGELEDSAEVSVTVNPVNDAPVANDDNVVTDEDTPVTIDVLPNDTDVDGDTLTIVNASVPADQGAVEIVDGKLVFTPADNFNGEATISYTVSDGVLEDSAEVSVTVNPINDAPVANDDSAATDEDTPVTIDVLTNDTDVDGDTLTIVNASVPADQGTVEIVDGKLVFTPAENFNGEATISYTVSDGVLEDSAEVSVTVNPINDAPVANDDSAATDEDTPVTIDVLTNDTDVDGDTLTIVNASVPVDQGAVEIVDGKLVFTPAENFNGEATISYTVSDGALEDSAEVSITVNPINDVPTVENTIADQSLEEDFTPYTIDLNDAFSDVDNADGELTFSVSGNSNIQVSIVDGIATITPTADWNGSEELTFTAEDPSGETVSQVVDFTVAAVADIVSDSADIVEDTPTKLDVLGNDNFEGDAPVVTVEAGHEPTNGTVVVNNDGTITYTPNQDYNGPDQFTYTVTSGGVTETTTVTLNVTPVNDKPVVENTIAVQSLEEDFTPYTIDLNDAFSDVDNADGELTFSVSGNSNIQVSIVDGIATITPTADWNGSEELTFTAEDPSGETVSQVVDFTVAAVADIVSDSADIVEDTPTKLDVLGNDNFEGDAPVVSVEAGHEPTNGTVVVNNDGTITYTPNQDYNGPDQFTYTVSSGGVTETTTVTLNVTPVNDKPLNEDFDHSANELITNVIFDTDDKPLDEGVDSDHISDLEDDLSGDELQIRITELPTSGTLYFKDEDGDLQEITSADGTLYDKDSIYYEADNVGFLLGIKDRPDTPDGAESTTDFYNWGLSADGGESHSRTEYLVNGASIDISSDSGVLAQYNQKVSHIGHGIADNDGQGIQPGETISIDLSENPVGSVNLGLDGLGGLFEHGSNNAALITVTYQDANGAEHTQVIEFLKPEGNSMLFQETSIGYGKDYGLPEGSVITQLDFSTKTSGNWELRYVEGFPPEDSFDYVAVDSGNAESDPATVTITNEVLDGNVSEDGPSLTLIGNSVVEGEDITFSVALDEVTETTVKYPIDMLAQGSSADNADVNLSNVSFTNGVTFAGGFLIVPAGVSAFEVIMPSIDDLALENAEDMVLEIGGESGIATIQDNDSTTLSVSQVGDVNEGSDAVFTVSLSNEVQDPFVVNLKPTTDGSYTAEDADLGQMVVTYIDSQGKTQTLNVTPDGDVTIPAGITSITVTIPTKTDGVYENTESFGLTVTDNGGVTSNGAATGDANIIDAESAPTVSIAADQASVTEGGDANFTVSIDQKSDEDVVVSFTIGGDVDGKDYQAPTIYTVTIPAGQTSVALDVTTLDDGIYEGTENLTITLTDTTGADSTLDAGAKEATVSITDAQSAPEVSISADQNNVNEGQTAGFTVTLDQVSDETVTVKFEYTGVAEDGKDFNGIASIEIPAGQSSADLDIATLTDGTYEGAESFTVTIKDVDGADAAIGANDNASVVINDAQQAPTVSIAADQASVTEGGDANFTVSIDQKSDEDVVVSFTIGGDVDGKDYQAPTIYKVTIPAGQTSVALDITTLDDGIYEGTENLTITLTDTTGADSTLDADTKEATVSIIDAQKEVLSLQNVVGLEDQFIELGIVVNDGDTSVQTVELNGIPQGSIIEIDGQASIVGSVDAIVVSIDDISSVKVKAPEHSDVNFDIAVIARDDSDTIVETGSIYVDVHPDADKPILNIGGFEQVAAIDFEDVTIKSGSWDSDIEINKVEGAGTVGQWFTSNPGQHVEVGTEGTYLPGNSTNQVMEIEGEVGDKVLYTDMDLVAGRFYNFEFDIAARTNKAHTSDMSVTLIKVDDHGNPIDGSEVVLYDFDPTTHGWHKGESITLPVEESGKYRLLFEADEADSTGAIMDNIKFTAVDNLGYEDSFIKLSEIDASLQDSLDQSESLTVELTGIPVGSVLRDGEGDSANTYVVTQENKDDRIDVTDWDLSNLQVKTQDAGIFAITVIATSTERDTNKDDEHGDHIDVGGSLTAESTASINVEVIDKPTSGGDNNERPEPDYTAGEDMIDSVAYRSGFNDFNWQQSAAYVNAGNPEQNGLYDYDPSSGVSIDVGTGNDKVLMGGGDDIIYLGESHVQVQDGDISDDKFSSVLADFAATELNALTDTFGEQDQHLKIESQSKPGLDIGHGGAGDDVIFGEKGSDIVFGGTGHDTLDGGDGSDAVRGGSGNDVLIGGSGDDILIGDDGEDIFKFVDDGSGIRDGEVDTIKDFTKGEDKIDISDLLHTDDFDSIDSLLANNEIGLEADGDNLILTISESDGSSSQKVVIEGGSNQYSELLSDGSLSPADGSAILNDLLKINNDIT